MNGQPADAHGVPPTATGQSVAETTRRHAAHERSGSVATADRDEGRRPVPLAVAPAAGPAKTGRAWRALAGEFRDYPATLSFCLIWIMVFAAMTYTYHADGHPLSLFRWLVPGFGGGHRFGDLTLQDLAHGQVWRLLTCNFIHYSLIHIGLNLLAMYQLGTLVESWYGPSQLVLIYGLTGGGGNLVSALIRSGLGANRQVHSAGGSVVILGLVGLCAVAGWRSRHSWGRSLSRQMAVFLVLTAGLGLLLPNYFDNWGHAGGALVGAVLGLAHPWFRDRASKPSAWGAGVLAGLVLAASGVAQLLEDRWEASPARLEKLLIRRLNELEWSVGALTELDRVVVRGGSLSGVPYRLDTLARILEGPYRDEVRALRPAVQVATAGGLSDPDLRDFRQRLNRLVRQIRGEQQVVQRWLRRLRPGAQPARGRGS
jgi:membrane associated rhomboid family serine protease